MRKHGMMGLFALSLGVATAVPAWADCQAKTQLAITADGAAIDASGATEIRGQGADQRFKVSIDARVADGTTFEVFANGQLAGTITIAAGAGQLSLSNKDGAVLPAGTNPVCGVTTVEVLAPGGAVVLQGGF